MSGLPEGDLGTVALGITILKAVDEAREHPANFFQVIYEAEVGRIVDQISAACEFE